MSSDEYDPAEHRRRKLAREGSLASALSDLLAETDDDEMERVVLLDTLTKEETGRYASLGDLPAVPTNRYFRAWSDNWVYYSHGDSSYPASPCRLPRHPPEAYDDE